MKRILLAIFMLAVLSMFFYTLLALLLSWWPTLTGVLFGDFTIMVLCLLAIIWFIKKDTL